MKAQETYDYIISEAIKTKDDNGNIENIKKSVIGRGSVEAFDEANAKIKAQFATDLKEVKDIDEVKIEIRTFRG
jgi:hypothetical protein